MTRRIVTSVTKHRLPPVSRERLAELGLLNPRGARRAQPEAVEQRKFAERVRRELAHLDLLWSAWPNGGKRSPKTGALLKAEGVNAGPPDLWFFEPRTFYSQFGAPTYCSGLVIEMKAGKNKPTTEQVRWLEGLQRRRWSVAVCYSADEAWDVLLRYLEGKPW